MSLQSTLAQGRRAALGRMQSRVLVRRVSGTTKDADGYDVPGFADVYGGLPCRLTTSPVSSASRAVRVGESEVEVATPVAHFPWNTVLSDGDIFEVVAGERAGRFFRVVEGAGVDQQTALRAPVVEVQRPEGWV